LSCDLVFFKNFKLFILLYIYLRIIIEVHSASSEKEFYKLTTKRSITNDIQSQITLDKLKNRQIYFNVYETVFLI